MNQISYQSYTPPYTTNTKYIHHNTQEEFLKSYEYFLRKYQFLYHPTWWRTSMPPPLQQQSYHLYMIHKIEIYPHYTYPTPLALGITGLTTTTTTNQQLSQSQQITNLPHSIGNHDDHPEDLLFTLDQRHQQSYNYSADMESTTILSPLPPYRTVSHYGFNYPSTYKPCVSMHPACSVSSVDMQRQKVIAFIKRLNMEAQSAMDTHFLDTNSKRINEKSGKEDHIYENTKKLESAESFVSVKEIQLNNLRKTRHVSTTSTGESQTKSNDHHLVHHRNEGGNHHHKPGDLLSEQFSSLLSISGTYPAATHSHIGDHDQYHFNTDSTDNCSNCDMLHTRKTPTENLYRNYEQRHFVTNPTSSSTDTDHHVHDLPYIPDPHKPECEQRTPPPRPSSTAAANGKEKIIYSSNQSLRSSSDNRHVTLTLNSLKRRASSLTERKDKSRLRSKSGRGGGGAGGELLQFQTTKATDEQLSSDNSNGGSSTAIEIHINVNIRNSDCIKNLQNHEQEFKLKLEKVIDNEIHLITQQLEEIQENNDAETDLEGNDDIFTLNPNQRCLSAPDAIGLYNSNTSAAERTDDSGCIEADRHYSYDEDHLDTAASTPPPHCMLKDKTNLQNLRYRHTLALLEHELEMLLNGIIRNMCDCKTKISQISEDIRTATLHVGSLCPRATTAKDKNPKIATVCGDRW